MALWFESGILEWLSCPILATLLWRLQPRCPGGRALWAWPGLEALSRMACSWLLMGRASSPAGWLYRGAPWVSSWHGSFFRESDAGGGGVGAVCLLWPGFRNHQWLRRWRICLQCRRLRFNPWVGKIPWKRNGNPLQNSCLENSMDYSP